MFYNNIYVYVCLFFSFKLTTSIASKFYAKIVVVYWHKAYQI